MSGGGVELLPRCIDDAEGEISGGKEAMLGLNAFEDDGGAASEGMESGAIAGAFEDGEEVSDEIVV